MRQTDNNLYSTLLSKHYKNVIMSASGYRKGRMSFTGCACDIIAIMSVPPLKMKNTHFFRKVLKILGGGYNKFEGFFQITL